MAAALLLGGGARLLVPRTARTQNNNTHNEDPFTYPELTIGLAQRKLRAVELNHLARKVTNAMLVTKHKYEQGVIPKVKYDMNCLHIRQLALTESSRIMYSVDDPHARQKFLEEFGCVKCTAAAVEAIKKRNLAVVEIGAGQGHWEKQLSQAGVQVEAFDNELALPLGTPLKNVGKVVKTSDFVYELAARPMCMLLIVYPPPDDMAINCLQAFKGNVFVYVGEGRNGANANTKFFDLLNEEWQVDEIVDLERFPQCYERMWVLRRRRQS
jgi:hypothetical protein